MNSGWTSIVGESERGSGLYNSNPSCIGRFAGHGKADALRARALVSTAREPSDDTGDDDEIGIGTFTVDIKNPGPDPIEFNNAEFGGDNSWIADPPPLDPNSDCARFVERVRQIADGSTNADEFMKAMVRRFIGSLDAASTTDFEKSATVGSREFGSSGFLEHLRDESNQVRHFTGGLWAGYLFGSIVGKFGMNSNESNEFTDGRGIVRSVVGILPSLFPQGADAPDVALNSISAQLGANLTYVPRQKVEVGDRGGWRIIPEKLGYKVLADAIRNQVCEP